MSGVEQWSATVRVHGSITPTRIQWIGSMRNHLQSVESFTAHMPLGYLGDDCMARRAHASHILLRQKSDAVRLLSEIQEARKPLKIFQKLAKKHSKCPSGQRGGDLGWFDERQMVREFSAACFEQPIQEVDRFVKTEFGYHLIWVHERED